MSHWHVPVSSCSRLQIQLRPSASATCGEVITVEWDDTGSCWFLRQWPSELLQQPSGWNKWRPIKILQYARNAVAGLVAELPKFDHTSETLGKMSLVACSKTNHVESGPICFPVINRLAPMYLADDCRLNSSCVTKYYMAWWILFLGANCIPQPEEICSN